MSSVAPGSAITAIDAAVGAGSIPTLTAATPGVDSSASTLNVSGGTIAGGAGSSDAFLGAAPALRSIRDALNISGGSFTGGSGAVSAAPGALVVSPVSCTISGGTFTGGAAPSAVAGMGGTGLILGGTGAATITGGTFNGGSGVATGYSLGVGGAGATTISGGSFPHGIALSLAHGGAVTFEGSGLAYTGGTLTGTLGGVLTTITIHDQRGCIVTGGGAALRFTGP
jgi:hypothetical protein